ncbi:MAG: hypothetical protein HY291_07475 [Planctomycetes bacterium]|nr:hypothetical protein [Planctomycetota bacterium]
MRIEFLTPLFAAFIAVTLHAAESEVLLADFEKDADKVFENAPAVTIAKEHAKRGDYALKIVHDGKGYPCLRIEKPEFLKTIHERFAEFPILTLDIFNPQDFPVAMGANAGDAKSKDYGSRYNEDRLVAPPGWSTLRLNLTGLLCSNSNNWNERRPLNARDLVFFGIFLHPHQRPNPVILFFDALRMENDGLPKVEGLQAFDFGPQVSGVFPGFTGVNEKTLYDPKAGFGWKAPGRFSRVANPDDLGGDFGSGESFTVDMKSGAGTYIVQMVVDTFGEWQTPQIFGHRTIAINGKQISEENLGGETFLKSRYLRFEDAEDLPSTDLWEERVKPALPVRSFEAEAAADGKLEISVQTDRGPGAIAWLVAYPKAKAAEGKAYLEALDKRRKELFDGAVTKMLPKPNAEAPKPAAEDEKRGFIAFACHTQEDVTCAYAPNDAQRGAGVALTACPDEREAAQIGFYPLKKTTGIKVSASDLTGPGGAKIPSSAVELRKVRHFYARSGNSMHLEPRILQPFEALTLYPGVSQGVWLTLKVPPDAAAGEYKGELSLDAGGGKSAMPVTLTVLPFKLDPAGDFTISCTGTTGGHWRNWRPGLEERWWKVADEVLRDQAEHGMNAVTGGPGFAVKAVKDGKAEIDFADADRWMALAVKYGLTQRGDGYQGFDASYWRSQGKGCMAENEKHAKQQFGIGFAELVKAVYEEVERHAKEKSWPPRSYYLLDEPRPEFGNVEDAFQFLELHVKAAPNTKFSGYYSPGGGRDKYFKTAGISIAHHNDESIQWCVENGKEAWTYTGGGARQDIGRWLFVAHQKGLTGFLRNGYQYVNSDAYYDFSDTEGSWAQTYPSKNGIASTVGWERTAQGVNDYRYLKTLQARIEAAKKSGAKAAEAKAAEDFLAGSLAAVKLGEESSAALKPGEWTAFRAELAKHIAAFSAK